MKPEKEPVKEKPAKRRKYLTRVITLTFLCYLLRFLWLFKNDNFQMKKSYIFSHSAQNIDCEYSLELPHSAVVS